MFRIHHSTMNRALVSVPVDNPILAQYNAQHDQQTAASSQAHAMAAERAVSTIVLSCIAIVLFAVVAAIWYFMS